MLKTRYSKILLLFLAIFTFSRFAAALEIEPFRTANRSPFVQIYGLPAETTAHITPASQWRISLTQDISSIYTASNSNTEQILLDGELYRWSLSGYYGVTDNLEVGLELPFIVQGGGFLDSFIIDWHNFWGLPQGGRNTAPKNRLRYYYVKNGITQLDTTHASGGIGDIGLLAAYKLFEQKDDHDHDLLTLRSQLKLPTGNSSDLLGSGSTDLALFLSGSMNRNTDWGTVGIFASAGGLYVGDGDILPQQQENLVGFGNFGIGWSPAEKIAFKVQCDLTTPFYRQSSLAELGKNSAQLTFGGTIGLPDNYLLDIGVSEDIAVATAPDVTFHLGLSKKF